MDKRSLGEKDGREQWTSAPAASTGRQQSRSHTTETLTPEHPFASSEKATSSSRHEKGSVKQIQVPPPPLPQKPSPVFASSSTSSSSHLPTSSLTPYERSLDRTSDGGVIAVGDPPATTPRPENEKQSNHQEEGHGRTGSNTVRDPEKTPSDTSPRFVPHCPHSSVHSHKTSSWRPSSTSHHPRSPHSYSISYHSQPAYSPADLESEDDDGDEAKESKVWILVSAPTPSLIASWTISY